MVAASELFLTEGKKEEKTRIVAPFLWWPKLELFVPTSSTNTC